jgi:hypothetical protein
MLERIYTTPLRLSRMVLLHRLRDCSEVRIGLGIELNAETQRRKVFDTNPNTLKA